MHPLAILGSLAVGAAVVAKAAKPATPPPPPVNPQITQAATALARGRMSRGASPEDAAAWAADQLANHGGFWGSKRRSDIVRF